MAFIRSSQYLVGTILGCFRQLGQCFYLEYFSLASIQSQCKYKGVLATFVIIMAVRGLLHFLIVNTEVPSHNVWNINARLLKLGLSYSFYSFLTDLIGENHLNFVNMLGIGYVGYDVNSLQDCSHYSCKIKDSKSV